MRARLRWTLGVLSLATLTVGCGEPVEKLWQYSSHSASHSTPAVSGNLIVFGTTSGELHALTRDGSFLWKFQTRKEIVSSPQILGGLVFFGSTNHNFYAVDLKGRQVWKYTTFSRIKGDVLVEPASKTVYFGSYDKHIYALDAVSRDERWTFPPLENSAQQQKEETGEIAVAAEEVRVKATAVDRSRWPTDAFSYAQPLLTSDGLLLLGNLDGHLYAVDSATGELRWRWGEQGAVERSGITSTVLEHEGVLYFGANDGKVHAIKLSDQSEVWTHETGGEVNSSPVIDSSGTLYIGSRDKKVYALDAKSGQQKWAKELGGPVLGRPSLYRDKALFIGGAEGDGHVYALSTADGSVLWKYKTGDKVEADVVVDGDRIFVASGDKKLYAFRIKKLAE